MSKLNNREAGPRAQTASRSAGAQRREGPPGPRRNARMARRGPGLDMRIVWGALAALALLIGGYLLVSSLSQPSSGSVSGGRFVADQGNDHIVPGQSHPPYNTMPPTSGWHYSTPAPWGISDKPVADEAQVHNLEHGGIMIQYWCPEGCADLVAQLKDVAGSYRSKVILAPYDKPLPNRIALTAWRWIDSFDDFDRQRIVSFIEVHKDRGPERVPD